jgi:hypothetical protein
LIELCVFESLVRGDVHHVGVRTTGVAVLGEQSATKCEAWARTREYAKRWSDVPIEDRVTVVRLVRELIDSVMRR